MKIKKAAGLVAAAALVVAATAHTPDPTGEEKAPTAQTKLLLIKEVKEGDTVWDVCARVAGPSDDLQHLVLETIKNNHLDGHPEKLQPGQVLKIRVKENGKPR